MEEIPEGAGFPVDGKFMDDYVGERLKFGFAEKAKKSGEVEEEEVDVSGLTAEEVEEAPLKNPNKPRHRQGRKPMGHGGRQRAVNPVSTKKEITVEGLQVVAEEDGGISMPIPYRRKQIKPYRAVWITEVLSSRDFLIEQLSLVRPTKKHDELLEVLLRVKDKSIEEVLLYCKISNTEFFHMIREARAAISRLTSEDLIDTFRPYVVESVMRSALPKMVVCGKCGGTGKRKGEKGEEVVCMMCDGKKKVLELAEHARQVTALQISGVLKRENAPTVVVNNKVSGGGGVGWRTTPEFRRDTDSILFGKQISVVDAKVEAVEAVEVKDVEKASGETKQEKEEAELAIAVANADTEQRETSLALVIASGEPWGRRPRKGEKGYRWEKS